MIYSYKDTSSLADCIILLKIHFIQRRNFLELTGGATSFFLLPFCSRRIPGNIQSAAKSSGVPFTYKGISTSALTANDLKTYYERFSNWGRWGKADKLGTSNFIDGPTVSNATILIQLRGSVSLARPLTSGKLEMKIYRTKGNDRGSAHDTITVHAHGYTETHIDALNHISSNDAKLYNGYPETSVMEKGATVHCNCSGA